MRTLLQAAEFGRTAEHYMILRAKSPTVRALTVHRYLRNDEGLSLEQFQCATERGHRFSSPGDEYDRCYCVHCGADGDA